MFIVLVGSELVVVLVPFDASADLWGAVVLRLLQLAVLCAVLGVGGDVLVLRRDGSDLAGLRRRD
jgi:hypothetical protein